MGFPRPIRRRVAPADGDGVPQTFDGQVGAGADDGYRYATGFSYTHDWIVVGQDASSRICNAFARFTNVTIPTGATVGLAYISVTGRNTVQDGTQKTNMHFDDIDDAVAPTSAAELDALSRTTASTAWDDEDYVIDVEVNSPDISAVVEEILDRGGWNSGQAMQLLWDDDGSSYADYLNIYSYDDSGTGNEIKLHVEFTA